MLFCNFDVEMFCDSYISDVEQAESLISQYEELKKSNKLSKYLIKKSKKISAKEAKKHRTDVFWVLDISLCKYEL